MSFNLLPPEILAHISTFLPSSALFSFFLLERRCYEAIRHLLPWRKEEKLLSNLENFEKEELAAFLHNDGKPNWHFFLLRLAGDSSSLSPHLVALYPHRWKNGEEFLLIYLTEEFLPHYRRGFLLPHEAVVRREAEGLLIVTKEEAERMAISLHRRFFCFPPSGFVRKEIAAYMDLPCQHYKILNKRPRKEMLLIAYYHVDGGYFYFTPRGENPSFYEEEELEGARFGPRSYELWWLLHWLERGLIFSAKSSEPWHIPLHPTEALLPSINEVVIQLPSSSCLHQPRDYGAMCTVWQALYARDIKEVLELLMPFYVSFDRFYQRVIGTEIEASREERLLRARFLQRMGKELLQWFDRRHYLDCNPRIAFFENS